VGGRGEGQEGMGGERYGKLGWCAGTQCSLQTAREPLTLLDLVLAMGLGGTGGERGWGAVWGLLAWEGGWGGVWGTITWGERV